MIVRNKFILLVMVGLLALTLIVAGCSKSAEPVPNGDTPAGDTVEPAPTPAPTPDEPEPEPEPEPVAPSSGGGDAAAGQELFGGKCGGCHGADGSGGFGPSFKGIADRMSEEDHIATVTDGRGGMPPFGGDLSEEEIANVVAYERSL